MNRQAHDPGAIAQAVQLYQAQGIRKAVELTGVPERTIYRWAARHRLPPGPEDRQGSDLGVTGVTALHPRPPASGQRHGWQPRLLLDRVMVELWAELDELAGLRAQGKARDARDVAVVVGVLLDKAQALAKLTGTTGRPDLETATARVIEMASALSERARQERGRRHA